MASLSFDHVHLVSVNPTETAHWYVATLGFTRIGEANIRGLQQIYLQLGDALLIVRQRRSSDPEAGPRHTAPSAAIEHFGFRVQGDLDGFCAGLRKAGVRFLRDPVAINAATRVAFIEGPDGVTIELLHRADWPALRHLGLDPAYPY